MNDLTNRRIYTANMLEIATTPSHHPRLLLRGVPATAWIEYEPRLKGSLDWTLWFVRQGRYARGKCQLRLEIESKLRSWLLRECRVRLHTLSYEELRLIAEGKVREALRVHARGLDTAMRRPETGPIPYASTKRREDSATAPPCPTSPG